MDIATLQNPLARRMAAVIIDGFNRHYRLIRDYAHQAKQLYEASDWKGVQDGVRERIRSYDDRVRETAGLLRETFGADALDDDGWQQLKLFYIGHLINHKQPELAETFFNSVCSKLLDRTYFNNDYIFARPAASTEYIDSASPSYSSYYPMQRGLRHTIRQIVRSFGWTPPFENLDRDVGYLMRALRQHFGRWPAPEANAQIQVLNSAFYRNKAAYIIGRAINGHQEYPFAVPVLHTDNGELTIDTILLDAWRIGLLFSLSRAYFMVDMEVPSAYVQFLRNIMPNKPRSEIYTMLGLGKQGKILFFRDLMQHLRHSEDSFVIARGIRGLVMLVFTLQSYPYVFKVIKDVFGGSKDTDRATVKSKYLLVKQVDRVGRMADTLEFSHVALPKARFSPELLEELRTLAPSMIEEDGEDVVIKHVYIERRMIPLNVYLDHATPEQVDDAVFEYGNAIRELACANIFPGDMLWKNFGVTRYGRVVFYDYDEIEYMTDCNFRDIPEAPYPEMEMSGEPWYSVAKNDIFPEEFSAFLLGDPRVRNAFLRQHRDLLSPAFWRAKQQRIRSGYVEDFFPYPETIRFSRLFAPAAEAPATDKKNPA
ncbi:bifunctional isocitrate dehydrogenase kinase/phosphatase [Rhodocyclus tenuis]|uniref:Isocitrate dehydrogenase kinase/phosphatase n=2 Tax=Rhodocyclus TaxID=1064 RepID=A0A6L5JWG5_RHOTE|nr:bifunctional isocitrate dehydrogenase kinase/phosphatase [Rhodocyclus gracilis]MQY51713.1 bifunctional isocitrate dehydrogenase kinase/phosphatase [Rhodocyclus gracilis]MRD73193.1 bifunctional isocitrate dehydrogenase kinase/phosphatase [Rhodocyclus gracilis]NJA89026.1 bifunctional isocitrate dehydrogenase kinase/phosphatase [Rhodocyclus gracilis]